MKRNNNVITLRPVASSNPAGQPAMKQAPADNGELEDHQTLMTRGRLIACLRDVHRYWSTPRISEHEIEELEQQNLIQRNTTDICAIRLTEHGAVVKNWQ
jgi:hypothetical protein